MGRTRKDEFTDEERGAIFDEQGPLAVLWNLQAMMTWAEDESNATFGALVRENCPHLINVLEDYLQGRNEQEDLLKELREGTDMAKEIVIRFRLMGPTDRKMFMETMNKVFPIELGA